VFSATIEGGPVVGVQRLALFDSAHEIRIRDEETAKRDRVSVVLFDGLRGAFRRVCGC
jgi:hypothetical protein